MEQREDIKEKETKQQFEELRDHLFIEFSRSDPVM